MLAFEELLGYRIINLLFGGQWGRVRCVHILCTIGLWRILGYRFGSELINPAAVVRGIFSCFSCCIYSF